MKVGRKVSFVPESSGKKKGANRHHQLFDQDGLFEQADVMLLFAAGKGKWDNYFPFVHPPMCHLVVIRYRKTLQLPKIGHFWVDECKKNFKKWNISVSGKEKDEKQKHPHIHTHRLV